MEDSQSASGPAHPHPYIQSTHSASSATTQSNTSLAPQPAETSPARSAWHKAGPLFPSVPEISTHKAKSSTTTADKPATKATTTPASAKPFPAPAREQSLRKTNFS